MKKTYINPTLDVIEIKANVRMLAGSDLDTKDGNASEWGAPSDDFDFDFDDYE